MSVPDLNMLVTLNVLLTEGNVARAADRLNLSPSAMSRALGRLRETIGDPLLVRAGRGLVPTPRAIELRDRVGQIVQDASAILRPTEAFNLAQLTCTFTLRSSDGFVENFGSALIARITQEAPHARLRFVPKLDKESTLLREGSIDLDIGVIGESTGPEVRTRTLYKDRFIGVVRLGHELCQGELTPQRYASGMHVLVSRRDLAKGPIDEGLKTLGLERRVVTVVCGFNAALALARVSDMIATVPERHTASMRSDLYSFPLSFPCPEVTVSMLWHPRMDADSVHRWFRGCVREICAFED